MNQRQRQKQATANRLFESALRLFAEHGYEGTTVEMITEAAGVAKGTFFVHFANKESLLQHINRSQIQRLKEQFAVQDDPQRPTHERLKTIFTILAVAVDELPEHMAVLARELLRQNFLDIHASHVDELDLILSEIVRQGQLKGEIRDDTPADELGEMIRGVYFMAIFAWLHRGGRFEALVLKHLDRLFTGLQANQAG